MAFDIAVKRVYEPAQPGDGQRVLVDRIWPRGVAKKDAALTLWMKDVAPSDELRKWFGHEPERWTQFQERYGGELDANDEAVEQLRALLSKGRVTLLFGAHDEAHNNAVALAGYLLRHPRA
ncbi:DUF488 domain-containing protein [Mesorhizobium amorphae]|uniref:Uroporphyrin-III C-methyltransferase n=1 Tax=Mesorhizobium amorphae CCNWGS0123 TaxID=1082933 RepID=G6YLD8_9HYPH|nr:DUF488 domain-containing protein [Mesorhizobium amorphae]ANT50496.1 hypothetical protein A6B35_11450 [Mesorhizobium amorphae CCNWGS0123]EHH02872.1 hypothetical protein MEA186_34119 [Mesorhizobium amorphae CCNWGS0123]GLR42232.1 hypothetical protein GCM10007880_27480 [Mesorhizobium amorphae]